MESHVHDYLKDGLIESEEIATRLPQIDISIERGNPGEIEFFPFDRRCCHPVEGFFEPPFSRKEDFFQFYKWKNQLIYRRGIESPTTVGLWNHDEKRGKILILSQYPNMEEIRVACFTLIREALKGYGLFPLHAAALGKQEKVVLIPAPGGIGKTTLSIALLKRSFSLLSDDTVFLNDTERGLFATGFPEMPRIGKQHLAFFPELKDVLNCRMELPQLKKSHVPVEKLFQGKKTKEGRPHLIFFLTKSKTSFFSPMESSSAFLCLAKELTYASSSPELYRNYFHVMMKLANSARSFIGGSPSPDDLAGLIENLLQLRKSRQ